MNRVKDLERIHEALHSAAEAIRPHTPGDVASREKAGGDPVTAADIAANDVLLRLLPREGEGWLSEETRDDPARLECRRVWVVDPLDGTREFIEGIPEWSVSVGLVEDGVPVAGGILNPATGECFLGSVETGLTMGGQPAAGGRRTLEGARVLASRSEARRGEWERYREAGFDVIACGSVAYKLALVAAGMADATWTLVPKNEWDVAAGAALMLASGGVVLHADGTVPAFNRPDPLLPDFMAGRPELLEEFRPRWLPVRE